MPNLATGRTREHGAVAASPLQAARFGSSLGGNRVADNCISRVFHGSLLCVTVGHSRQKEILS